MKILDLSFLNSCRRDKWKGFFKSCGSNFMLIKKTNHFFIIFCVFSISILLYSCGVEQEDDDATQVDVEDLLQDYNYYGFKFYYEEYEPSQIYMDSIKISFKPDKHKYILFTSPSCFSCGQTDSLIPYASKVIKLIGLNDSCHYLFNTPKVNSAHPFDTIINLERLPSAYVRNGDDIHSLLDTLRVRRNQSDNYIPIEQVMFELLK